MIISKMIDEINCIAFKFNNLIKNQIEKIMNLI